MRPKPPRKIYQTALGRDGVSYMMKHIIVLGGGAGGMLAAIKAAENKNTRVTLLEQMDRVGKKVLATGNGRCNLSNANIDSSC